MIHMVSSGITLVGACTCTWFGIRSVATVVDVFQRWRKARKGDRDGWK